MKIKKNEDFSEWYTEILKEAELADIRYNVKGFVVFMPWSVMTMEKMYGVFDLLLQKNGHVPAWFPLVIPESNFKTESEHVEGFAPEVFWITEHGAGEKLEERLALRPTSETAMYKMYSMWIQGRKDLPLKIYQRASVYRYETKATRPFFRSREFYWIEAHDVFATEGEAMMQVKEDMETTHNALVGYFCLPHIFFQRPQWDKFAGAINTYAADTLLPDGKAIQLPSTHMLGQNFAKPFGIKFRDNDGTEKYGWQTCYGPAISRIYGAMISVLGDDKGLVLPFGLAPVQIVIIPIIGKGADEKKIAKFVSDIETKLKGEFRVKIDNDADRTPGFKFNYWEMKGVPIRIEIGMKEADANELTVARRDTGEKQKIKFDAKLGSSIAHIGEELTDDLRKTALANFDSKTYSAGTKDELKKAIEKGGFVKVPYCSIGMEGKECADGIKTEFQAHVRGVPFGENKEEKPKSSEKCVWCGKPAKHYVYVARQY